MTPQTFGPLEMLVIQATPFCNLDCSYCYLPNRESRKRIQPETLDLIFKRVFADDFARAPFLILWHAGEPFALPPSFYEDAFHRLAAHNPNGVAVRHSFQTNATLISKEWCEFIKKHRVSVGVSIDGPEFLNDRNRRTRGGNGTFSRVLKGIHLLQEHAIEFGVISVLTRESLDYPDELYDFYRENGFGTVGFNVEEVEGLHTQSSMATTDIQKRMATFLNRFYQLVYDGSVPMRVREFDRLAPLLSGVNRAGFKTPPRAIPNAEVEPFAFINVDHEGRFSTFSPEMLGMKTNDYGEFFIGQVQDTSFAEAFASEKFKTIHGAIARGVHQCKERCEYFAYCGGGAPVNKYFENGSFDSMESLHCRLSRQTTVDAVFNRLERQENARNARGR